MKKILFLIDNINRDFKCNALIAYHLENEGWTVTLCGIGGIEYEVANEFKPDYIVIPKLNYDPVFQILWSLKGIKIILLDTEGNAIDQHTFRIIMRPDLLFFWNKRVFEKYHERLKNVNSKSVIIGSARTDILHPKYKSLIELETKRDLKNINFFDSTVITIATAAQDVDRDKNYIMKKHKRREMLTEKTIHFEQLIKYKLQLRNLTEVVIKRILSETNCTIVIKPHPREEIKFWISFIESLKSKRVFLMFNESIETLLNISNIHFAFEGCTTSFESGLMKIPTAEFKLTKNNEITKAFEKISICDEKILNEDDAIKFIRENKNIEMNEKVKSKIDMRIENIEQHLGPFTGESSFHHAREIIKFNENSDRSTLNRKKELIIALINNFLFLGPRLISHIINHKRNLKIYSKYVSEHIRVIPDKEFILSKKLNNFQRLKTTEEYNIRYYKYYEAIKNEEHEP